MLFQADFSFSFFLEILISRDVAGVGAGLRYLNSAYYEGEKAGYHVFPGI